MLCGHSNANTLWALALVVGSTLKFLIRASLRILSKSVLLSLSFCLSDLLPYLSDENPVEAQGKEWRAGQTPL